MEGARLWLGAGLELPEQSDAIKQATQTWRESTDLIYAFVSERLVDAAGEYVEVEDVREAFNAWLPPPHQAWGRQTFGERFESHEALRALGAVRGQHPRTRRAVFKGLALV